MKQTVDCVKFVIVETTTLMNQAQNEEQGSAAQQTSLRPAKSNFLVLKKVWKLNLCQLIEDRRSWIKYSKVLHQLYGVLFGPC